MNIDIELAKLGFKWIINFNYNVGDCLFDAIMYSLKYKMISKEIWENNMFRLKCCLNLGTSEIMECCTREFDFWLFYQFYTMKK